MLESNLELGTVENSEIFEALAKFQQECPIIHKATKGHGYTYADLPQILSIINPLLKKNGLAFTQPIVKDKLVTIIVHVETGQFIRSEFDLSLDSLEYVKKTKYTKDKKSSFEVEVLQGFDMMNKPQAVGSIITYARRYALSSVLGIVTDKDSDGGGLADPDYEAPAPKEELTPSHEKWTKAVNFIYEGNNISVLLNTYSISEENTKKLKSQANDLKAEKDSEKKESDSDDTVENSGSNSSLEYMNKKHPKWNEAVKYLLDNNGKPEDLKEWYKLSTNTVSELNKILEDPIGMGYDLK